jgi:hypothetical protein
MEKPIMPLIQLNLMDQVSTPTQKKEIVSAAAMAPFEGETMRPVTWVSIEGIWSLEWSIGGPAMTTGAVPDFVAGKK